MMRKIYSGDRFMFAQYKEDGKLLMAGGGQFRIVDRGYTETMDFFTVDPGQCGKPTLYKYIIKENKLLIEAQMHGIILKETWQKEDRPIP